jgi:hypothetical protein
MLITKLIFIAVAASVLGFAVWREIRLLRATIAERQYWGSFSQALIFLSVDFLAVVFLSYLLGTLSPSLGRLSHPPYARFGFSSLLVGITAAGLGEAVVEARRSLAEKKHVRFGTSLALGATGLACAVVLYLKFLRS